MDLEDIRFQVLSAINDIQQKSGSADNVEVTQIEALTGLDTQTIEDELDLLEQEWGHCCTTE